MFRKLLALPILGMALLFGGQVATASAGCVQEAGTGSLGYGAGWFGEGNSVLYNPYQAYSTCTTSGTQYGVYAQAQGLWSGVWHDLNNQGGLGDYAMSSASWAGDRIDRIFTSTATTYRLGCVAVSDGLTLYPGSTCPGPPNWETENALGWAYLPCRWIPATATNIRVKVVLTNLSTLSTSTDYAGNLVRPSACHS